MLPSIIVGVFKQIFVVFVSQINFISRFECHVSTVGHFVGLRMQFFVANRVGKILWLRQILRDVRNETHIFDVVVDEIVVFRAVLAPNWA